MGRIVIDPNLKGKALTEFLVANKSALIAQKKSMPIKYAEPVSVSPTIFHKKGGVIIKAESEGEEEPVDLDEIRVKVVANAALWCDSHWDVLIPDCWAKTIKDRKGLIPHLHDHIHRIEAEVGDVVNIYSQDVSLTELGLSKSGTTQCLIFETDIKKVYNEKIFNKYKSKKIKQHSIGLQYVKIELAINDEESEKEYDFWNKYIDRVINKEYVEELGFFWVVTEIKLLENSAVLFGSNELTPTLEVGNKSTDTQPLKDTDEKPLEETKTFKFSEELAKVSFFKN